MAKRNWLGRVVLLLAVPPSLVVAVWPLAAQNLPADKGSPPGLRLTLDEIKQRVLADSKLLQLAARNVQSKDYAARAARALYFPQVIGNSVYFHFNDSLGSVVSTPGRTLTGPRGTPITILTARTVNVPLIDQNSEYSTINIVQPLTDLLKVRQGVKIARADEGIAQAQLEQGRRELVSGVEQLFWGLLAAQRIRAGLFPGAAAVEQLAKTGNLEARIALVEGKQSLQEVSNQIAGLQEQLAILLDLPASTQFDLVEPPLPVAPVQSADEAVALALGNSPEIQEAEQTICKARAAVCAAKLDYVPSIAVVGGYANNNLLDVVQPNFGYVGVVGSITFVDWGKRRNIVRERNELVAMATLKMHSVQDTVRQNTLKAFREYGQTQEALNLANELVSMRAEAAKSAAGVPAQLKAGKDLLTAQVDAMKADLAHRIAFVQLMSLIGRE